MVNFGKYKAWVARLASYVAPMNFVMLLYLFIIEEPLGVVWQVWFVVIVVFIIVLLWFDIRVVFPLELEYQLQKNPEFGRMSKNIKYIMELLDERFKS